MKRTNYRALCKGVSMLAVFALLFTFINPPLLHAQTNQVKYNQTVLLQNRSASIPLNKLGERNIAVLLPEGKDYDAFHQQLNRYTVVDSFDFLLDSAGSNVVDEAIKLYNTLLFVYDGEEPTAAVALDFIRAQAIGKEVIVLAVGAESALAGLQHLDLTLLWMPHADEQNQRDAAMSVFGGKAMTAKLSNGSGMNTVKNRLSYDGTAQTSINAQLLTDSIDAIMADAISGKAAPGGVVMVIRDGNVIFEKAYGHHTYEAERPTRLSDIFDLASISKIAATTPVVMRLTEQNVMNLDSTMGHYLWRAKQTNKNNTTLRSVMLHETGFIPFIPFYRNMDPNDLSSDSSADFSVKVADGRFIRTGYYENIMWPIMLNSNMNEPGKYVYSDISMYVMKEVAEHQTGRPIETYIQEEFYKPLGMVRAGYNPRERFERTEIVPTENDVSFRKTLLEGYVHDQGAAMAGGIAGHAGLFSNANDLAIYGQLLLNRGEYGGERYFEPETVDLFTSNQSASSRRGLGFDRQDPNPRAGYPAFRSSSATYGHTGYTGTSIWMDPEQRLIYIFLSNRVHPEVSEQLGRLAIRRRVFESIYSAIGLPEVERNVAAFHQDLLVVDGHNDALITSVMEGLNIGERIASGHTDIPRLKEGGVDVQVFAVWSDASKDFRYANEQIDSLMVLLNGYPHHMELAVNSKQMREIASRGKIAAVIGVEGGHMIEDRIDYLDSLHRRGMTYLTLTWNNSVSWATSASDETRVIDPIEQKGLSDLGRKIIRHMNDIGVIPDLSHVGRQTFFDVMEVTSKPVLVTHSNAAALMAHPRNLDDDQLEAVKQNGGVIGVNFYSGFLDPDFEQKVHDAYCKHVGEDAERLSTDEKFYSMPAEGREEVRPPLSILLDHIDYLVNKAGVNHVAIGSDFDGVGSTPQELDDVSDFPVLTKALLDRGYSQEDVRKIMGENLMRVYEANGI